MGKLIISRIKMPKYKLNHQKIIQETYRVYKALEECNVIKECGDYLLLTENWFKVVAIGLATNNV